MEVKPGYKQTEVGVIPEEWDVKTLGDVGSTYGGLTGKTKADFGEGPARYITFMNVMSNVVIDCGTFEQVQVSPTESQNRAKKGDLFLNGSSESPEEVAMCSVLLDEVRDVYLNSFCFGFRFHDGADADGLFLAHYLRSKEGRELMKSLAQGSTRYNLSKVALLKSPLRLPKLSEQTAIATALSDVDGLLGGLDRLIAKKRDLKQAAMQQLLTGQTRLPGFHGEWEVKTFEELFNFSGGYSASRDQLSSDGHCYLHYGDIHGAKKPTVDVRADYQNIPKLDIPLKRIASKSLLEDGDVVFVDASEDDEGASRHVVVVNKDKKPFISGLHTIVAKSKTDEMAHAYRRYCFQTAAIRQQFLFYAVGTKVSGISKTNIAKLKMPVPKVSEQTAIAEVLTEMDAELAALEQRREKTRALKQAMMQELLTGRTRLV